MTDHKSKPSNTVSRAPWLTGLAVLIALIGAATSWWFYRDQQAHVPHPEAALFQHLDESRVLFADVLRSQDSEAAVASVLEAASMTVQRAVIARPPSPRYPPRRMATLTVRGYKHLDCEGVLTLEFFNDRLMEADFRPDDAALYAPRLHRALPGLKRNRTGQAEWVEAPLRVWSNVDLAKSKVGRSLGSEGLVIWQDLRLIAQRDDWDARFGSIPIPAAR